MINIKGRVIRGPYVVTTGLLLYIDPANTRSYSGSGTTVNDISGNAYNGTLYNGVTFSASSFVFDGIDAYVGFPSTSNRWTWTPSGSTGLNTMTIDLWVKTTDSSGYVISKPFNGAGEYNYWIYSGNTWYVSSGGVGYSQTFTAYTTGLWENITCIVTPTQVATYRNGTINANFANHGITGNTTTYGDLNVDLSYMTLYPYGVPFVQNTFSIDGSASILRIYNRVLTAAEVNQNFNAMRERFGR